VNISRSSPKTRFDVACYLAKSGLSVGVFERRGILAGGAITEEFHPGFRNSTASYTVSLLNPKVTRDLRLVEHGLKVLERPMQNFLPLPDGRALTAGGPTPSTRSVGRAPDGTQLPQARRARAA
jgi:phytoene dehydrogenase-like protein